MTQFCITGGLASERHLKSSQVRCHPLYLDRHSDPFLLWQVDFDTGSADLCEFLHPELVIEFIFALGVPGKYCFVTCHGHQYYDPSKSSTSHGELKPDVLVYGSGETITLRKNKDKIDLAEYTVDLTGWCLNRD